MSSIHVQGRLRGVIKMKGWHRESYRHALAARGIKTMIPGGLAEKKYPDLSPEEWVAGIKVEMEHTDDENLAAEIALDHLSEFPEYYTKLLEWEKQMKAKGMAFKSTRDKRSTITSQVCNTRIDLAISVALDTKQQILAYPEGDPMVRSLVREVVENLSNMGTVCSSMPVNEYHYNKFVDIVIILDEFSKTGVLLQKIPNNYDVAWVLDGAAYSLENAVGRKGDHK